MFQGLAEGIRQYTRDTQSAFGLSRDMARSTAQAMQQGFKSFFFDVMTGKIQALKEAFASLLNFTQQIVAQIASQLVTNQLLAAFVKTSPGTIGAGAGSEASVFVAGGGMVVRRFAMGGPVPGFGNQDTVPALLTPGEVVLSRGDVSEIKNGLGGRRHDPSAQLHLRAG